MIVRRLRAVVPPSRQPRADEVGRIVYHSFGSYFAGSLLVAVLNGLVILTTGLLLGVPLAPIAALWATLTNFIPQIGGFLGGAFFVLLALTQSPLTALIALVVFLGYQQLENNVISPAIVGNAVNLTPPTTMLAALVGRRGGRGARGPGGHPAARGGQGALPRPARRAAPAAGRHADPADQGADGAAGEDPGGGGADGVGRRERPVDRQLDPDGRARPRRGGDRRATAVGSDRSPPRSRARARCRRGGGFGRRRPGRSARRPAPRPRRPCPGPRPPPR